MISQKRVNGSIRNMMIFVTGKWTCIENWFEIDLFRNWGYSEPNGGYTANCAHVDMSHGGTWDDINCNGQCRVICESTKYTNRDKGFYRNIFTIFILFHDCLSISYIDYYSLIQKIQCKSIMPHHVNWWHSMQLTIIVHLVIWI